MAGNSAREVFQRKTDSLPYFGMTDGRGGFYLLEEMSRWMRNSSNHRRWCEWHVKELMGLGESGGNDSDRLS